MLFNSLQYLIFLPLVIILYYLLPHRIRWVLLLFASYYFYMVWKPEYVILIILSTLIDYFAAIMMEKQNTKRQRRKFLILSLFVNLGLLFAFKYFNFLNGEMGYIYGIFSNNSYPINSLKILLPMGISFYTFQTLSYSIDVYRGNRKAERHLGYFALYVTYFPQLVAGPIERSDRLLPQLKAKHKFDYNSTMDAILRISWGFFKKVVIADRIAVIVDRVYGNLDMYTGVYLIVATLGFAIQIYCDFSAYSDIAIGSAQLMGVNLMENFETPYFSKSIKEFWERWHISLSTWFKDYLYIPLGGNRVDKKWKYYRNLMIVFVVSGLWHGANWTFIIWGLLHGLYILLEKIEIKSIHKRSFELPSFIKQIGTFTMVLFAWIFFRSENLSDSIYIISNLNFDNFNIFFDNSLYQLGLISKEVYLLIFSIACLFIIDSIRYHSSKSRIITNDFLQGLISVLLILFIILFGYYGSFDSNDFIYFQF